MEAERGLRPSWQEGYSEETPQVRAHLQDSCWNKHFNLRRMVTDKIFDHCVEDVGFRLNLLSRIPA